MWFWLFMLAMVLMVPFTMLGFGHLFLKSAPKEINSAFGYRTAMSMKNQDTWQFAHKYCGKVWRACGFVLLFLSAVIMVFALGQEIGTVGKIGLAISGIQISVMIGTIFSTERALKKHFDGNRTKRPFHDESLY